MLPGAPLCSVQKYFPVRIEQFYTIADSGGAGLHRGGNGINIVYRFLEDGEISIHDDRWLTYPWGVNGGLPGRRSIKILYRGCPEGVVDGGTRCVVPSKIDRVRVKRGDVLHFQTWGGGGWGNPLKRDPSLVGCDVRRGLVTIKGALEGYGVVVDDDGVVDDAATMKIRSGRVTDHSTANLFNFGFKPSIRATKEDLLGLLKRCEVETGLKAPLLPEEGEHVKGRRHSNGNGHRGGCC